MNKYTYFIDDGSAVSGEALAAMVRDNLAHLSPSDPAYAEQTELLAELTKDSTQNDAQNSIPREKVEALAAAIEEAEQNFMDWRKIGDHDSMLHYMYMSEGMKEAFEILTGESYINYFIRQLDA